MCKIHVIKLACGHRVHCKYSTCRDTFTKSSRSKKKVRVQCSGDSILTLYSKTTCCSGILRSRRRELLEFALDALKDIESTKLEYVRRTEPRYQLAIQEGLAEWSNLHDRLERVREARGFAKHRRGTGKAEFSPRLPRTPQPRTSKLRGSLLRFEVKPCDIAALTDDFEGVPGWLFGA